MQSEPTSTQPQPVAITPQMMDAACGQYGQTIIALSARLANQGAQLTYLQAENAALKEQLAAAAKMAKPAPVEEAK